MATSNWLRPSSRVVFTFTRLTASMLFPLVVLSIGWSPTASAAPGCDGAVQCRSNTGGGYSGSGSSSNDAATSQAIQQGGEMLIQMLEDSDNERRAQQEEEQRQLQQEIMLREQEKQYQLNKARQDPSLNPWSDGPTFQRRANTPPATPDPAPRVVSSPSKPPPPPKPKDPDQNYAGKSCEYFTRPSDEAHLNYHADGTVLSYGKYVYKCENRRWKYLTTRDKYWASTERLDASWFEGGSAE